MNMRLKQLISLLRSDEMFISLSSTSDVEFALSDGEESVCVKADNGTVSSGTRPEFTVELDPEAWGKLLEPTPAPRTQHVLAFLRPKGAGQVFGSSQSFAQHLHLVRRAVEVLRGTTLSAEWVPPSLAQVTGGYLRTNIQNWGECDVFVERVGKGQPVLLLATAGADSRQWHGIMSLNQLIPNHELIAFDLPWHGKSNPPHGKYGVDYYLNSATYTSAIREVINALDLDQAPILVGASMAGAAVIEATVRSPDAIAGAVSCQAAPRVSNRHTPWLRNDRVNQALHIPEWTYGLMSPTSPTLDRDRTWWGYSQGGFGVYERDIAYYTESWDLDNISHLMDTNTPPIAVLNGVYDYSVPPSESKALAEDLPDSTFRELPNLGHFPHAENPVGFLPHLEEALVWIDHRREQREIYSVKR